MSAIEINGQRVPEADLVRDATDSDYILIKTTGEPLNSAQTAELSRLDVRIQEFVGNEDEEIYLCGYKPKKSLDEINQLSYVQCAGVYAPEFCIPTTLQAAAGRPQSDDGQGSIEVHALLHHDVGQASAGLLSSVAEKAGVSQSDITETSGTLTFRVDPSRLNQIAQIDQVRVVHPVREQVLYNTVARKVMKVDNSMNNVDFKYGGQGQIVCVADTGFDMGSAEDASVHPAFKGRVAKLFCWGRSADKNQPTNDPDGHGTHVAGSVLGRGTHAQASEGQVVGTAPGAKLILQSTFGGFNEKNQTTLNNLIIPAMLKQAYDFDLNARVHTNSWGTNTSDGSQLGYEGYSEDIDQFIWENQDMTILFAAGNNGTQKGQDGNVAEGSLGSQAAAKSSITVGASENNRPDIKSGNGEAYSYGVWNWRNFPNEPVKSDHQANNIEGCAAFSSRGPTAEGRLKPDIMAPGTAILSARSRAIPEGRGSPYTPNSGDDNYAYSRGTSMATPLVAGCCAVLRQKLLEIGYKDVEGTVKNPTGSLVKALLINGADLMKGQYKNGEQTELEQKPNVHSGFGRVNMEAAMPKLNDPLSGYKTGIVKDMAQPFKMTIPVPSGSARTLKITLAYADPRGKQLQNNLQLIVVVGNKERHGNMDPVFEAGSATAQAKASFDQKNNVEQVVWPAIPAGTAIQVSVQAQRLVLPNAYSGAPFALAWRLY